MEKWIADVVGKMHIYGISQTELANQMGVRREHLNKILNGKDKPKNAEVRISTALNELILKNSPMLGSENR